MVVASVPTRLSRIDSGIGPTLTLATLAEIDKKRATHVSFHANRIQSLDVHVSPQYLSKNKEEEVLRTGAHDLVHVMELDLSSNNLSEGYSPPRPGVSSKIRLLPLCTNLVTLNLASNGLSQKSFANLFGMIAGESDKICLAPLQTLDISNNAFDELPRELHIICPSLKNLTAANNRLKSLTSLLQSLHKLRGKLESIQFVNKSSKTENNPVCSKDLYREKVIFVLGPRLSKLDNGMIHSTDREKARLKLEQGLSILSESSADEACVQEGTPSSSRDYKQTRRTARNQVIDDSSDLDHEDNASAKRIRALEEQLALLAVTIEKQVSCTDKCRYASLGRDDNVASPAGTTSVGGDTSSGLVLLEDELLAMRHSQMAAAAMIMRKTIMVRQRQRERVTFAFCLWSISTQLHRSNEQAIEWETSLQIKTMDLVNKAVKDETRKNTRQLELSDEKYQKMICYWKLKVNFLKGRLENQLNNQKQFSEASNVLKSDFQHREAALRQDVTESEERARLVGVELDRLRRELHVKAEELAKERNEKISEIQRLTNSYEQAMESVTTSAAHLHKLKLENIEKDNTIQSIKSAYEHAARRSAADKSRYEQAIMSEQKFKDLLCRQAISLRDAEAETNRVVADNKSKQTDNAFKLSRLSREAEEKDHKVIEAERRLKVLLEERNDMQAQLVDCNRSKSRTEERNNHLEAQLDKAADDIRNAKLGTVDRAQLDEAMTRAVDLKHSFDMLHESSQQRDQELQTKKNEILLLRQNVAKYDRMMKSLSGKLQTSKRNCETKERQLENAHGAEMQKLRDQHDSELSSAGNELKAERAMRIELERKAAAAEIDNEKQRLIMRNAIEGLARQLAGT